jgi:GT2 family glycosyltransferase
VFAENDVVYQRGWLNALIACADETGADMVAPLTCEGRPLHTIIHHVGTVESNQDTFSDSAANERDFDEDFFLQGRTLGEVEHLLVRRKTQSVEMHCFMVRRDLFDRIGQFDPDIVSKEYLDFSWRVTRSGGSIWLEPKSVVTFLVPSKADPVALADLPYFLLRWSRSWQKRSHDALKTKWGLTEDGFIASRRALADWRIVDHVTKPALERVPVLGRRWGFVARAAGVVNAALLAASNWLAWGYDRARRAERPKAAAHATH